jgi:acyl-CoA thioesterase-1
MKIVALVMLLVFPGAAWSAPPPALLIVGDSLSAGFGIEAGRDWVALLEQRLRAERSNYRVINASISGDTTANGLARLPRLLREHRPKLVIIELGGNDGLRGLSLEQMGHNLAAMAAKARSAGAQVLLIGVDLPPNYGRRYTERFRQVYAEVARRGQTALVPSILQGIGDDPTLMQTDGIHPNAAAQARMLDNVWPRLRPLL